MERATLFFSWRSLECNINCFPLHRCINTPITCTQSHTHTHSAMCLHCQDSPWEMTSSTFLSVCSFISLSPLSILIILIPSPTFSLLTVFCSVIHSFSQITSLARSLSLFKPSYALCLTLHMYIIFCNCVSVCV